MVKNPPASAGDTGWSLVRKDPACCKVTKPMGHKYWAHALQSRSHNYWAHTPIAGAPCSTTREALQQEALSPQPESSPCLPQLEKDCSNKDPIQSTVNNLFLKITFHSLKISISTLWPSMFTSENWDNSFYLFDLNEIICATCLHRAYHKVHKNC